MKPVADTPPGREQWGRRHSTPELPVTPRSIALFRLGEQCSNRCLMCSNSGRPELQRISTEDLLRRVAFLHAAGMPHVVLTGGEPTIHPGFGEVVAVLGAHGIAWDICTNGRRFADEAFTAGAVRAGLQRAVVSLHTHDPRIALLLSGGEEGAWRETHDGICGLLGCGVPVAISCVLTRPGLSCMGDFLQWVCASFGTGVTVKVAFPTTAGRGGAWEGIHLRYAEIREEVRTLRHLGDSLGMTLLFESIPNCILGDAENINAGRSRLGETHYLDDLTGDRLYAIRHLEAQSSLYAEVCRSCRALNRCPGVPAEYARRYGSGELEASA